jgi:hypothetical protein
MLHMQKKVERQTDRNNETGTTSVQVQYAYKVLFTIKLHLQLSQKQYLIIIS